MPFGLCNAPSTFQRTMNNVLAQCRGYAKVYIDDIVIYLQTFEENVEHIRAVLQRLCEEKLYAKLKKCTFAQPETEFCWFLVRAICQFVRKRAATWRPATPPDPQGGPPPPNSVAPLTPPPPKMAPHAPMNADDASTEEGGGPPPRSCPRTTWIRNQ